MACPPGREQNGFEWFALSAATSQTFVSDMESRAKLIATLSAFALACASIATLALGSETFCSNLTMHDELDGVLFCSTKSDVSEPTFYSETTKVSAHMHEGMELEPSGDIDRDFMRMMIPHHQGAIDMALLQLKYGHDEKLKRLAQSIIVEQGQEIAYMRSLLDKPSGERSTIRPAAER
jgi:Domain of unknown function (DUF305)